MPNKNCPNNLLCFNKFSFIIILIVIIIIIFYYINNDILNIYYNNNSNDYNNNNNLPIENLGSKQKYDITINENPRFIRSAHELNAIDRIYNPTRYPYRSVDFYNLNFYPDLVLPPTVIGGGRRAIPTLGGTQTAISSAIQPVLVDNDNIAPINIRTRGPIGLPQQIGSIMKVFGTKNDLHPLFGRKRYPNGNQWDYYTIIHPNNVKVKVITPNNNFELGNNDTVILDGFPGKYRVTVYDTDFPQYIPY